MTVLKSKETLVKSILVILIRCTIMTLTPELGLEKKVSFKIKRKDLFINNDGSKYTGTRMIDGNLYYFEIDSGVMQKESA